MPKGPSTNDTQIEIAMNLGYLKDSGALHEVARLLNGLLSSLTADN
jgi:hypothetical protein